MVIKSLRSIIRIKPKINKVGWARILNEKDLRNLNWRIKLIARVIPQAGQGRWKIVLNKQGIWKILQMKNINTNPPKRKSINIFFFLVN